MVLSEFGYVGYTFCHYNDDIVSAMASQIIDVLIVCFTACSGADQRKHQSSASLAFVRGNQQRASKVFPFASF